MPAFTRWASGAAALLIAASVLAADPNKVLRISFHVAETGFDPVRISDVYSATVNEAIFERLLTYDYLARPAKLVPMTAESMPEVSRRRPDVHVPAAQGHLLHARPRVQGRRSASSSPQDFVYSFMRFADPKNRSPYAFMLEGKIDGLDEQPRRRRRPATSTTTRRFPGSKRVDRYTLRFRLKDVDYQLSVHRLHTCRSAPSPAK